jgi:ABC-type phosphate transport system substrate-binding protein
VRTLILAVALVLVWGVRIARADFVVVKNAKNPTAKLTKEAAKGVFSGRTKTWSNNEPILLVIGSEDSPAMTWLAQTLFGVSAKTFLAKIKQDVFKGDVVHPLSADDDAKTIKRVQSGAGVVGVVTDKAAQALPGDVAVLPVQ